MPVTPTIEEKCARRQKGGGRGCARLSLFSKECRLGEDFARTMSKELHLYVLMGFVNSSAAKNKNKKLIRTVIVKYHAYSL